MGILAGSLQERLLALKLEDESSWALVQQVFEELLVDEPGDDDGDAPTRVEFGGHAAAWEEVRKFYDFWGSWNTRRPFQEAGAFSSEEIAAAANRAARRCMEQENERRRKAQRSKFSGEVREAVAALRDRDPRVQARARACAEEARDREALREAEEDRRQAERQERRRAARELELQRWEEEAKAAKAAKETEAAEANPETLESLSAISAPPATPPYPGVPSPWICTVCEGKAFPSRQAYEDRRCERV